MTPSALPAPFLPLRDTEILSRAEGLETAPFIVVTMFTPRFAVVAERLRASLQRFGLPHLLYLVPSVHFSISGAGTGELAFSKPNLIANAIARYGRPVLYIDADMLIRRAPEQIHELVRLGVDFASYNWLADNITDGYLPAPVDLPAGRVTDRFYKFAVSVDRLDDTQLFSSSGVQFFGPGGLPLLRAWLEAIATWPRVADDQLLDYAFNLKADRSRIRAAWLGKSYCRIGWWIHVSPVIDHPDIPTDYGDARDFEPIAGVERFRGDRLRAGHGPEPFPRDALIDTRDKVLIRPDATGAMQPFARFTTPLWLGQADKPV